MAGADIEVRGLTKRYGSVTALEAVSLRVEPEEFVTLLGPSGCGKTTLLKIIAGFVDPSGGEVRIGGQRVNEIPPHRRGVGIVFQNYALFPHMTVAQNVAFGPKMHKADRVDIQQRVSEALSLVKLNGFEGRFPGELSGGQQQRVALARVIAVQPRVVLLDEPFGALDKNLRMDMQIELKKLLRELGITAIFVTHDQEEALTMSDRIAVMERGSIVQCGSPIQIYDAPASPFVATFIGTSNLLAGALDQSGGALVFPPGFRLPCRAHATTSGGDVRVVIRPENLLIQREHAEDSWRAVVTVSLPLGASTVYEVQLEAGVPLRVSETRIANRELFAVGEQVFVRVVSPDACRVFPITP